MVCEFSTFFSGIECRLALSNVFMLHRVCRLVGSFSNLHINAFIVFVLAGIFISSLTEEIKPC